MGPMRQILLLSLVVLLSPPVSRAAKTLDMYAVDTEGGKALLIIAPSGQSMLIDTGFGKPPRDGFQPVEFHARKIGDDRVDDRAAFLFEREPDP